MPQSSTRQLPRRLLLAVTALALSTLSCGREPTAPGDGNARTVRSQGIAFATQFPAAYPLFDASGAGLVEFTKVRIILNNPDGTVALDTVVDFPAGATEFPVTLSVPLPASTPASGLPLALSLKYVNAAGDIVFTGGPVTVNAVPVPPGGHAPPPAPVTIPLTYTGPGANARSVRISPSTLTVNTGGTFTFTAQALDAGGIVVPNTPIVFASQNQVLAAMNAATGVGTAGSARGTVGIVAQLLTGPTDVAALTITSPPASIAAVSGSGQTAPAGATLAQPVVVQVNATDGLPATGVAVAFAAQSGGTVGAATVTTDAAGQVQTTWTLGTTAGAQTLSASATGLSGSPVTFTATATPVTPVRLAVGTEPPASTTAGATFGIVVNAVDASNVVTTGFTGAVTVALGSGAPVGAVLSGTTTVTAVAGVATFTGLSVNIPGTYTLVASTPTLTSATSTSFTVVAGAANKLAFQNYPIVGAVAGTPFDPITVDVRDALGNAVTSFTGAVSIVANGPSASIAAANTASALRGSTGVAAPSPNRANALGGTTTVNAVGGVATFTGISLTTAGAYTLTATASGLTTANGPVFSVSPGAAGNLVLISGGGQSAAGGATLANPVGVRVTDAFGNGVGGVTVNFLPAVGSGTATPASAVSDAAGAAQTAWTLQGLAGAKTLNVSGSGLSPNPLVVTATATTTSGTVRTWTGTTSTAWAVATNWSPAGVPASGDQITIPSGTSNAPSITAPVSVLSLTVQTGATLTNTSTLTVSGSLDAGTTIVGGGTVIVNGSSGTLAGTITGNVTVSGGAYTLSNFTEIVGSLTIASNAKLDLATQELKVDAALSTTTGGRLGMTSTGYVTVYGNTNFGGGSEAGFLTSGTMYLLGNFTAAGPSFGATGTHEIHFDGNNAGTQTITYTSPVGGQGINIARFSGSDAKVLVGTVPFMGDVRLQNSTSAQVTGVGATARIGGNFADSTFVAGGGWGVDSTEFFGSNVTINSEFITSNVAITGGPVTLPVNGCGGVCLRAPAGGGRFASFTDAGFMQINGNLTVRGSSALLKINGNNVDVEGDFATASGGKLDMTDGADNVTVFGNTTFGGGSTAGLLTLGSLYVFGNFTQAGAADAFAPSADFYTEIDGFGVGGAGAAKARMVHPDGARTTVPSKLHGSAARVAGVRAAAERAAQARAAAQARLNTSTQAMRALQSQRMAQLKATHDARRASNDARRAAAFARHGLTAPPHHLVSRGASARAGTRAALQTAHFTLGTAVVTFANPTTSFFGTLYLGGSVALNGDIGVAGMLEADGADLGAASGAPRAVTSHGAEVFSLFFDNVRWVLLDGSTISALDDIEFADMDPTVDQFTISRTSDELTVCEGPCSYQALYWVFATPPTTGHYINASDTNGGPNVLTLQLVQPYPGTNGGHVATAGGAQIAIQISPSIVPWPDLFRWTGGGASSSWDDSGNWNTGFEPSFHDDVLIPAAALTDPSISSIGLTGNLTIEAGRKIDLGCNGVVEVNGNLLAPTNVSSVTDCGDGSATVHLEGDGVHTVNTVTGYFDDVYVDANYLVGGQLIVTRSLSIDGSNLDINGGRIDVGGPGGTMRGRFYTTNFGTLTMTHSADQMFVGTGGAWFEGGSTTGLLTAGTITLVSSAVNLDFSCLHAINSTAAADAFAPSGTHKVVFTGPVAFAPQVEFFDPTRSFLNDAEIAPGSGMVLGTDVMVNGTLTHGSGTGTISISSGIGVLNLTVNGVGLESSNPTSVTDVALHVGASGPVTTIDNVTWTGYVGFTGTLLDVGRTSGGPFTFNVLDFSAVTGLGAGGQYLMNNGSQALNILGSNPSPGNHFSIGGLGTGTINWP